MPKSVRGNPFTLLLQRVLCAAFFVACNLAFCQSPKPDIPPGKPELNEADRVALELMFERFEAAFNANSVDAITALLTLGSDRSRIIDALTREFRDVEYSSFQIEKADPEYRINKFRISVDVTLRHKLSHRDNSRPTVENHTIQTFIVHRRVSGEFLVVNSSFFDNMGKRNGGTRLFLDGFGAIMLLCVLLVFWVWMGSAAWMMRPRSVFWRFMIFIPLLGALLFLLVRVIPSAFKRSKKITAG